MSQEGPQTHRDRSWARWWKDRRPITLFGLLVSLVVIAIEIDQVRRIGDFRVDDAYITFSFSKNLAEGNGPIYSHNMRVEGYSNFLWMMLIAGGYLLRLDPYLTARALSFFALSVCLWSVYRVVSRSGRPIAGALATLYLACCTDLTRSALSGLETTAYVAALAYGWSVYLLESPDRRRFSLLAFTPTFLMRIDGFVPAVIVGCVEFASALLTRRFSLRRYLKWALPPVLIWLAYFAWRYAYYGLPLPTTYYAKQLVDAVDSGRGFRQLVAFWQEYGLSWTLPLAAASLLVRKERSLALPLIVGTFLTWGYAAYVGGDWMPFHRFLLPGFALYVMTLGLGLAALLSRVALPTAPVPFGRGRLLSRWALALCGSLALAYSAKRAHSATTDSSLERQKLGDIAHVQSHTLHLVDSMRFARHVVREPGDRWATDYAGVFALFTEAQVIDIWGLCNQTIALEGGATGAHTIYGKTCPECFPRLDPHYFHPFVPFITTPDRFKNQKEIVNFMFQGPQIDRYLKFSKNYVAGYVLDSASGGAFWFLEKRLPDRSLAERDVAPGMRVVYPFEESGTAR